MAKIAGFGGNTSDVPISLAHMTLVKSFGPSLNSQDLVASKGKPMEVCLPFAEMVLFPLLVLKGIGFTTINM